MRFDIKGFKTWSTHDGGGYQFNLYLDGKKFAFVHNDGNGGMIDIEFDHPKNEDIWDEYVASFGQLDCLGSMIDHDTDIVVDKLVNDYEMDKRRKKCILFRLVKDGESTYRTINTLDIDIAKTQLTKQFGADGFILI